MPILGVTASSISGHLIAPDTGVMFPLGMVTLASAASFIEFTSIPDTYQHLQLRFLTASTNGYTNGHIAFNGDTTTTNYYANRVFGNGNATGNTAQNTNYNWNNWNAGEANMFVAGITDILNYSDNTKRKVSRTFTGFSNNVGANTDNWIAQHSLIWNNTNKITSVRIYIDGANLFANSQATLYGIKGA
jgi:hypothetical protein